MALSNTEIWRHALPGSTYSIVIRASSSYSSSTKKTTLTFNVAYVTASGSDWSGNITGYMFRNAKIKLKVKGTSNWYGTYSFVANGQTYNSLSVTMPGVSFDFWVNADYGPNPTVDYFNTGGSFDVVDDPTNVDYYITTSFSGSFANSNLTSTTSYVNPTGSATVALTYTIGTKSATDTIAASATSKTKSYDTSWYSGLPSATSGTLTVTAKLMDGTTTLMTSTKTYSVTIPDSVKPSITACSFADNAGYARYIKSLSAVKINSMTYAVGTGSTLKSISIKVGSQSAVTKTDGTYPVSGTISTTGSLSVVVTVTDNRSRSATYTGSITAYDKADLASVTLSGTFAAGNLKSVATYTLPKSSGYSATITYTIGSKTETNSSPSTSTTKNFDSTWYAGLPSATSGTLTVTVTIKEGSSTWTTKTATLAVTIPDTVKPSITAFTVKDRLTTVPSSWGIYVQGLSAIGINTLTYTAGTGSTISTIKLKVGSMAEKSGTPSSWPTGDAITGSGTMNVVVTVTDARGRSATSTVSITVYAYSAPAFTSASSVRCDASSVDDDEGTRFKVTTAVTYSSCNGKNSITLKVEIKPSTSSTYGTAQTISANTTVLASATISANYAYDVRLTLTDQFNTSYHYDYISTALYMIHFKTGGTGIAFGQKATIDDMFDCNFKATFRKTVTFTKSGGGTVTIDQIINALGL